LLRGNWQDFNWQDSSRGPSAIAELLVTLDWVRICPPEGSFILYLHRWRWMLENFRLLIGHPSTFYCCLVCSRMLFRFCWGSADRKRELSPPLKKLSLFGLHCFSWTWKIFGLFRAIVSHPSSLVMCWPLWVVKTVDLVVRHNYGTPCWNWPHLLRWHKLGQKYVIWCECSIDSVVSLEI